MREAYTALHRGGVAHSIEIWRDDDLVGGLYGVRLGKVFFGESMFSSVENASKMALAALVKLAAGGALTLIDCQMETDHLMSLGARAIPREEFEKHLADAINDDDVRWTDGPGVQERLDQQLAATVPARVEELQ
jgi:leucyl/phenylalanyl-tRNA--protein transferase